MMKELEDLEPRTGRGNDEEDAKGEEGQEGELDEVVQLDEKGCLGRCCSRHCCWVFMKWPWVATAAVVLLITGLVMWASTTSPALGKTQDAFKAAGGNISDVVSAANGFIAVMTVLSAIMIVVVTVISISRFELDVYDRQLDPRRFRYLATKVVGFLTLIILSLIFIAAALLVGFMTVWLAAALVTTDVTEYTGKALFRDGGGGSGVAEEVCPENYCFDASSLPFLNSDECICGDALLELHDDAQDAQDLLIIGVIGIYLLIFGIALAMMATSSNCMHLRWRAHMLGYSESAAEDAQKPPPSPSDFPVAEPAADSEPAADTRGEV